MKQDILAPTLPESVSDGEVGIWHKKIGQQVNKNEVLVEIETDKVILEVCAPCDGILDQIIYEQGATVKSEELLGSIKQSDPLTITTPKRDDSSCEPQLSPSITRPKKYDHSPSARRLLDKFELSPQQMNASGVDGRLVRADFATVQSSEHQQPSAKNEPKTTACTRVPMSRIRKSIAEKLVRVSNDTAMLTTFNEVNMQPIMDLRTLHGEQFFKQHQVKLGFMSFYVKAVVKALARYPQVHSMIDGDDIVQFHHCDMNIAIATDRGLLTPVIRRCEDKKLSDIEHEIADLAQRARSNKLVLDDLTGGSFTISNGGVFGSLFSTPLLNTPQNAILGVHAIKERPIAENGQVVIRPMVYLALSYDHRLIDGKDAAGFLVHLKTLLENPALIFMDEG